MIAIVHTTPSMLDLMNYKAQDLRRTAQTALVCLALLFILDAWLLYQLFECSSWGSEVGTPGQWHAFWLPILTNLVSTVICVLGAFWLFFRSNPPEEAEQPDSILEAELTAIRNEIEAIRKCQADQAEAKFTMDDFVKIIGAFSQKDKTHSNTLKAVTNALATANNTTAGGSAKSKIKNKS